MMTRRVLFPRLRTKLTPDTVLFDEKAKAAADWLFNPWPKTMVNFKEHGGMHSHINGAVRIWWEDVNGTSHQDLCNFSEADIVHPYFVKQLFGRNRTVSRTAHAAVAHLEFCASKNITLDYKLSLDRPDRWEMALFGELIFSPRQGLDRLYELTCLAAGAEPMVKA